MTYNILVWTNDIGKFAKDFLAKSSKENINKIIIIGNEIKVEDLKLLDNITAPIGIDEDVFDNKRDTELFILGQCSVEKELGLVTYLPADKTIISAANKLGISLLSWASFCTTKKESAKTIKTAEKKKVIPTVKEATTEKTTARRTRKTMTTNTDGNNANSILRGMFPTITDFTAIERAIKDASDPAIGLPMLLGIYCGMSEEESRDYAQAIAPRFKKLKDML